MSVDVIVRQRKRIADEGDFGRVFARGEDFNDVETEPDVRKVEQTQPRHGTFGHATLFIVVDRVGGTAAFLAGAGFHLDENKCVFGLVAADEIDLAAAGRDKVAVENAVAVTAQILLGLPLAPLSEDDVAR